jgi:peroxidase
MYYINLLNHQGVFTSDQDLASHPKTKEIVNLFASNQKEFFNKFANAFVKVSQLDVLTGNQGEIRKSCFAPNNRKSKVASISRGANLVGMSLFPLDVCPHSCLT